MRVWMRRAVVALAAGVLAGAVVVLPMTAEEEPVPAAPPSETGGGEDAGEPGGTGAAGPGADLLRTGRELFAGLRFEPAIRTLTEALAVIGEAPEAPGSVVLRCRALDLRAQSYLSVGRAREADADFEALVRTDPAYELDALTVSPKIVQRFQKIREGLIGYLSVGCDPTDAGVRIDGRPVGQCPVVDRPVLAGGHTVFVERDGFDPAETSVTLEVGGREQLRVALVPNVRAVVVRTDPAGVEVLLDGKSVGVTPSGEAGTEGASGPLRLEGVTPGEHLFTFRKECWRQQVRSFVVVVDLLDRTPALLETVRMTPAVAALSIGSDPPGARVLVDGTPVGSTPLEGHSACAGPRTVEARFQGGVAWRETLEVRAGQPVRLTARPRPELRFEIDAEAGALSHLPVEQAKRLLEEIETSLRAFETFNVGEATGAPAPEGLRVDVRLFEGTVATRLGLSAISPFHSRPERWEFDLEDRKGWEGFLARLDEPLRLRAPASGLVLIDTLVAEGVVVLSVRSGSPAAAAGLKPGEEILPGDGQPRTDAAALAAAINAAGRDVSLRVRGDGGDRTVSFAPTPFPTLIPLAGRAGEGKGPVSYHKAAVEAHAAAASAGSGEDRSVALVNLAAAFLHFGENARALREALARAELPAGAGISRGTVLYLSGLAYERLGMTGKAAEAFSGAAGTREATLNDLEGPLVAPRARVRLGGVKAASSARAPSSARPAPSPPPIPEGRTRAP